MSEEDELCAETVRGDWSSRRCSRKAGHGQGGLYCKQHSARHPDENAEAFMVYKTVSYSSKIQEVEAIRETDHCFFLKKGERVQKVSDWCRHHKTKEEAVDHLRKRLEYKIESARNQMERASADLAELRGRYGL